MNENEDSIFSITVQQTSSTYEQGNNLVHPPDSCPNSARSQSKSSRNPRNRKTKLERAKEMLLKGSDLPRSYYMDENLFPDLVDSLQDDYNQLMNQKSLKKRSQKSNESNYNTEDFNSSQQKQQINNTNKNKTYNPNSNNQYKSDNNNFSKTGTNNSVNFANTTNSKNYNNDIDDNNEMQYDEENESQNVSIRTINTKTLKSSEVVYKALKKAQEYYELFVVNKEKEKIQDEIKSRLKSAKTEKRELIQMIDNQEKNMELIFQEEENKLIKKHDKEIQKFNDFWESEKKHRDYNKSSDTLRLLRKQADLFLMNKQYQESAQCQKRADELEIVEIENRRLAMNSDYDQSLKKLQDKQNGEMKTLTVRQKMKRTEYQAAKNEEMTKINSKISKIENELEKSKDPNFINRLKKAHEMNANSVNCFTASKYRNSDNPKTRQAGPNVVSSKRPAPRSYRNFGKMEVSVADFNQVPLPPLRTDYLVYKAQSARK